MKKVSFKKKFIPLLIIALAVTSMFVYSKSSFAEFKEERADVSVELNVEKVDKDTVKISLDNFTPVVKSLQLGVKIDGDVKFLENTIKWLVSSDDENFKSNIKISDDKKVMDIFIVSTSALNKVGGKLEICEIDVNKAAGSSSKYKIIPNVNNDGIAYSYLLNDTNKQVSGSDIANLDKSEITLNSAPKLELAKHPSVIEGKVVISKDDAFNPLDYVIATDDEDGEIDKSKITVSKNEVKPDTVGSYNISYSVEDSEGEVATLDTTVIVEAKPTEEVKKPVITITNKIINTNFGEVVNLLDGVKATDYLDREIQVEVSGDYDFNKVGTYTITYNAIDRFGNKADEVTATLVVEATKPVITITNNTITIKVGENVNLLAGVKAVDYLGKEIEVVVSGDYDFNKVGSYTIKYNATDSLGNKADEVTATLIVEESSEEPGNPGNPSEPEIPGQPGNPEGPSEPEVPGQPENPGEPSEPEIPGHPENPGDSNKPEIPVKPEKPGNTEKPSEGNQGSSSNTNKPGNQDSGKSDLPATGQGVYFGITIIIGIIIIGSGILMFSKSKKKK
ncbi:Beta antigen [uncultured Clostridium sp.]|uniref:immunoglobulin-like domain-containing protein n=1 Tax=uncultured Clostridium sp. TaxID=59620 RepID=UPI00082158FC|nr:immunoglobulin-like domain-containing protein [uncultured Clostridium sp.]SCJ40290.1 Beta antigen [uncultured Clostridium sp.]